MMGLEVFPIDKAHKLCEFLNDPEIVRFSERRYSHHSVDTCLKYIKSFSGTQNKIWRIDDYQGLIIGEATAYVDKENSIADVGILIGRKHYWRKGFGKKMFMMIVDYLFKERNIRKITAGTMSVNIPMLKLMESLNMKDDGVRKNHYTYQGKPVDIVHKALFREDWMK